MNKFKGLFYFSPVWPKNNFSAACERVKQIHDSVGRYENYTVHFISPQKMPFNEALADELKYYYTKKHKLDPNEIFETKSRLKSLHKKQKIEVAIFDTFIAEEYYSLYVRELKENTLHIIDTQDLHFIRQTREKQYRQFIEQFGAENLDIRKIINFNLDISDQKTAREINSIFRSDLVLVCSDFEQRFLLKKFNLQNIFVQRFDYVFGDNEQVVKELNHSYKNYNRKKNFVWIGNFQHEPNYEAVKLLCEIIWPKIRNKLPNAELHIYGANFPKDFEYIEQIQGIKKRNLMKELKQLSKYRVLLAPLFFGAGIKGWMFSTPTVTTPIGAEGLFLESFDQEWDKQRIQQNKQDQRFYKPEEELAKKYNPILDKYYEYNFESDDFIKSAKQLNFGGSFLNFSYIKSY